MASLREAIGLARRELQAAAKPIKQDAQTLALASITHLGGPWSRFRIGIAGGGETVYLAPASKRKGGSPRPNLAPLLLHDAMEPAVDRNTGEAVAKIEAMVDRVLSE